MKPIIYVVEDDSALQELYTFSLENDFECRCFGDGAAFFDVIEDAPPNLIILDIMLPNEDGYQILTRLKSDEGTSHIPVVMVSAKGEEISKVRGLNMGADDYISKPFGVLELIARIKANLRKVKPAEVAEPEVIAYKDVAIELLKHQAVVNGTPLQTTLKEYNLLKLFCENPEVAQGRDVIFNEVWGENYVGETRTLDIHIKELRRKLTECNSQAEIKTIRGVGYILT